VLASGVSVVWQLRVAQSLQSAANPLRFWVSHLHLLTSARSMPTEAVAIICLSPLTYARERLITASHWSRHDMLAIISSRYQYGPFLFFVAEVMSSYLTTDGLKIFSLLAEAPLWTEARGICHICHVVNPALLLTTG